MTTLAVVHEAGRTSLRSMKWHRIAGTVLIALCGLALIGSASAKFAQVPRVVTELNAFGFQGKLLLIATGEALSAVLFLVPRTRSIGLLLVSGLLGGAIATHMQHGQPYVGPAVLLLLVWLGTRLRHPEALWSLTYRR
jgi:hypothetical protein